jgi:hypothetical protein
MRWRRGRGVLWSAGGSWWISREARGVWVLWEWANAAEADMVERGRYPHLADAARAAERRAC